MIQNYKNIDTKRRTDLCRIMTKCGSDKGNGHNYTIFYSVLFEKIRNEKLNIFEVGLGTNNVNIPSNMGKNGIPGASLRGWKEYFQNSDIYGADIDKDILFSEDRIQTFHCDQTNPEIIKDMWEKIPVEFDIMVDDGLHTFEANICFFENSFHKLKQSGYFIIEDIWECNREKFESWFSNRNINYQYIGLNPHTDNNFILIWKM